MTKEVTQGGVVWEWDPWIGFDWRTWGIGVVLTLGPMEYKVGAEVGPLSVEVGWTRHFTHFPNWNEGSAEGTD